MDNLEGIKYDEFYFAVEGFQNEAADVGYLWYELGCLKTTLAKLEKQAKNSKTTHDDANFRKSFLNFVDIYVEGKWRNQ